MQLHINALLWDLHTRTSVQAHYVAMQLTRKTYRRTGLKIKPWFSFLVDIGCFTDVHRYSQKFKDDLTLCRSLRHFHSMFLKHDQECHATTRTGASFGPGAIHPHAVLDCSEVLCRWHLVAIFVLALGEPCFLAAAFHQEMKNAAASP